MEEKSIYVIVEILLVGCGDAANVYGDVCSSDDGADKMPGHPAMLFADTSESAWPPQQQAVSRVRHESVVV